MYMYLFGSHSDSPNSSGDSGSSSTSTSFDSATRIEEREREKKKFCLSSPPSPLFCRLCPGLFGQPLCSHRHSQPYYQNTGLLSRQGLPIQAPQAGVLCLPDQLGQVCGLRGHTLDRVAKLLVRGLHQNARRIRGTANAFTQLLALHIYIPRPFSGLWQNTKHFKYYTEI